jgi:hypothetical protein
MATTLPNNTKEKSFSTTTSGAKASIDGEASVFYEDANSFATPHAVMKTMPAMPTRVF